MQVQFSRKRYQREFSSQDLTKESPGLLFRRIQHSPSSPWVLSHSLEPHEDLTAKLHDTGDHIERQFARYSIYKPLDAVRVGRQYPTSSRASVIDSLPICQVFSANAAKMKLPEHFVYA